MTFTPDARTEFARRLTDSWRDLANRLNIPRHEQDRFRRGEAADAIWDWLDVRKELSRLPEALDKIDRPDLAETLRRGQTPPDVPPSSPAGGRTPSPMIANRPPDLVP